MLRGAEDSEPGWSARDEALWVTAELGLLLRRRELGRWQGVVVPFPLQCSADETPYVFGPFRLLSFEAPGGGIRLDQLLLARRGALPQLLGLGAAHSTGTATSAGISWRRHWASAPAHPRWVEVHSGTVTVSGSAFYLHTPTEVLPWCWESIEAATLIAPGSLHLVGGSADGPFSRVLESDWAELILLFWASARRPEHEQLRERTWLPEEWVSRASAHSRTRGGSRSAAAFQGLVSGLGIDVPPQ